MDSWTSLKYTGKFFLEFLHKPTTTGAVVPSSRSLARKMVEWLNFESSSAVIEYGAGTGVFTDAVLARLAPHCKFFIVEMNPVFVKTLRSRFPRTTIYEDTVKNVRELCDREQVKEVDSVISGLPWASFPDKMQTDYLEAMIAVLKPGGQFVTFAYLHGLLLPYGRRFRSKLHEYFCEVSCSDTVWMNLPPALVYRCRRQGNRPSGGTPT